jgi:hypothetical protein
MTAVVAESVKLYTFLRTPCKEDGPIENPPFVYVTHTHTHITGGVLVLYKAARALIHITVENLSSYGDNIAIFLHATSQRQRKQFLSEGWYLSTKVQGIIFHKMVIPN